jgi:DNA sulfur modification protein DndC
VYCDTGVENPVLDTYAKKFLRAFEDELTQNSLPFKIKLL